MSELLAPGRVLAQKYALKKLLGQGGMGSVWLAENLDIGRTVAIKLLLHRFANDAEMLTRFRLEARAAAAIGHPGIVDVLDMGQLPDGSAFIVMEQLRGETLGERLSRLGPLPFDAALWAFDRIADAIGAAHAAGVVHRDLKPDNLFLVRKPVPAVKVLDFGISKFKSSEDLSLTRTGMTMGTPLYMSPEQARGAKEVGPATDLYSLGAIFYHALVGVPPFQGESYNELLARVLTEAHPPIAQQRPDLPPPLGALVDALLAKQGNARPTPAQIRATIAQCYAAAGLSKETPESIAQPPGLDEPSAAVDELPLGSTSQRRTSGETPRAVDELGSTSQRTTSGETPLAVDMLGSTSSRKTSGETPIATPAPPPDDFDLGSTSPSQRRPSAETPIPPVAAAAVPAPAPLPAPRRRRSLRALPWIALGLLFALVSAGRALLGKGEEGQPGEPAPVVVTGKPNPAPQTPRRAKATIEVTPSDAVIQLTPGGACANPCTFEEEHGREVAVALSAAGYEPKKTQVVTGWQDIYRFELTPLPNEQPKTVAKAAKKQPPPQQKPVENPVEAPKESTDDIDRGSPFRKKSP